MGKLLPSPKNQGGSQLYWCQWGLPCPPKPPPHLCNGLKQWQVEPLEDGKGSDAACHLDGRHRGNMRMQVSGYLLEDLGLVEIQFSLKEQRESSSYLQGAGTGAVPGWVVMAQGKAEPFVRSRGGLETGIVSPSCLGLILSGQTKSLLSPAAPTSSQSQCQLMAPAST